MAHPSPPPRNLAIGTADWHGSHWQDQYFPIDLPADWRMGYYANELDAVLLERSTWTALSADELTEWGEDLQGNFRLFFAGAAPEDGVLLNLAHDKLGKRFGGALGATKLDNPHEFPWLTELPEAPADSQIWRDEAATHWLARLDIGQLDPRAQRDLLAQLAAIWPDTADKSIVLVGASANPDSANQFKTLTELMGLA